MYVLLPLRRLLHSQSTSQELVPRFPLLAALFDKMTTPVVSQRFTAKAALSFFENAVLLLTDEQRHAIFTLDQPSLTIGRTGSYWTLLPPSLSERWKDYKSPPPCWHENISRYIFNRKIGWDALRTTRERLGI